MKINSMLLLLCGLLLGFIGGRWYGIATEHRDAAQRARIMAGPDRECVMASRDLAAGIELALPDLARGHVRLDDAHGELIAAPAASNLVGRRLLIPLHQGEPVRLRYLQGDGRSRL